MKLPSAILAAMLIAAILTASGNWHFAEDLTQLPGFVAEASLETSEDGEITVASGTNRFAVWHDNTPSNRDIFFRRSIDNGANWQPKVNLSNNPGESVNPQIKVVGSKVYVVWSQETPGFLTVDEVYLMRSLDDGATWEPKVKISATGSNDISKAFPKLAAVGSYVYVGWYDDGPGDTLFRRSTDSGATWKTILNLSNSGTVNEATEVALAAVGTNVHVAWDDHGGSDDILLRSSTNNGGTFGPVKNLGDGSDAATPSLEASGSNVYVGWSGGAGNNEVFFTRSTDNGASFSAKVNLSNNAGHSFPPRIAVSGVYVFVVWPDNTPGISSTDIFMRRSINSGSSFQAFKNLSNDAVVSFSPQVAAEGANVYFVWQDNGGGNNEIFFRRSSDNGATIQPEVNLSNNLGGSRMPQVTTVGANVYVIWPDNTPSNFDILIKRSSDNGVTWKATKNLSLNSGESFSPKIDG